MLFKAALGGPSPDKKNEKLRQIRSRILSECFDGMGVMPSEQDSLMFSESNIEDNLGPMLKGKCSSQIWRLNYATATADEGGITAVQDESAATDNNDVCSILKNMHTQSCILVARPPAPILTGKEGSRILAANNMAERVEMFLKDDNASHELSMSEREQPNGFESQMPFRLARANEDSPRILKGTLPQVRLSGLSQETSA